MNAAGTKPQPSPEDKAKGVQSLLLTLVLLSGILVVSPFFRPGSQTPGLAILAFALFLPYLVVCWRLLRTPGAKDGPGLAAGIGLTFAVIAIGTTFDFVVLFNRGLIYVTSRLLVDPLQRGLLIDAVQFVSLLW